MSADLLRGGIAAVPQGQFEAARALGLREPRLWRRVVIPQTLPVVISPLISNMTLQLKGTSLAALITVPELTGTALEAISYTYRPFEVLVGVSLAYLVLDSVLTGVQMAAERRFVRPHAVGKRAYRTCPREPCDTNLGERGTSHPTPAQGARPWMM